MIRGALFVMGRRSIAAIAAVLGTGLALPAAAQFGGIFGDPAPRPPASVPGGRQMMPTPSPNNSAPPGGPYYGGPQSQPLPPPPAAPIAVEPPQRNAPPPPRSPRVPPPIDNTPQTDEVADSPAQRVLNNGALFTGLDKITGRIINFDVAIGETVQFGALQLTPRACYTRPTTESARTDAFVEVEEVTLQGEVRRIFTGWMFAASPGLHGVEHPIYDIWLTDCKDPAVTAEKPPAADPAPPPARTPTRPPQQQQPPRRTTAPQQTAPVR
jgi:hypothetical protein